MAPLAPAPPLKKPSTNHLYSDMPYARSEAPDERTKYLMRVYTVMKYLNVITLVAWGAWCYIQGSFTTVSTLLLILSAGITHTVRFIVAHELLSSDSSKKARWAQLNIKVQIVFVALISLFFTAIFIML